MTLAIMLICISLVMCNRSLGFYRLPASFAPYLIILLYYYYYFYDSWIHKMVKSGGDAHQRYNSTLCYFITLYTIKHVHLRILSWLISYFFCFMFIWILQFVTACCVSDENFWQFSFLTQCFVKTLFYILCMFLLFVSCCKFHHYILYFVYVLAFCILLQVPSLYHMLYLRGPRQGPCGTPCDTSGTIFTEHKMNGFFSCGSLACLLSVISSLINNIFFIAGSI